MNLEKLPAAWAPRILSIARIVIGLTLLQHPSAKFFGIPHIAFFDNLPMSSIIMIAGAIELVAGVAFLLGFYTRATAFLLSGHLAFVYLLGHAQKGYYSLLNGGESAVLFFFIFLYYAIAGAGPCSLDALLRRADPATNRAHA